MLGGMPDLSKATVDWANLIIAGLAVIVSSVIALALYWRTKRGTLKGLAYNYTSAKLVITENPFGGNLKISFSGMDVQDASLVSVTLRSSGGASITKADYEEKVTVKFVEAQSVLAVQFADLNPPGLHPILSGVSSGPEEVVVEPLLLNPGDRFTLLALVSRFGGQVQVTGRIAGVSRIEQRVPRERLSAASEITEVLVSAVGPTWIKGLMELITKLAIK
jgi:hypothetical protein